MLEASLVYFVKGLGNDYYFGDKEKKKVHKAFLKMSLTYSVKCNYIKSWSSV